MSKPKSFKEMAHDLSKRNRIKYAVAGTIAPAKSEVSDIVRFLNSLRCPLCKGQIEGSPDAFGAKYCVTDRGHYLCCLIYQDNYKIDFEDLSFYDNSNKYNITKKYFPKVITTITIEQVDQEHRLITGSKVKRVVLESNIFDFSKFNIEKSINKIKTILVFQ